MNLDEEIKFSIANVCTQFWVYYRVICWVYVCRIFVHSITTWNICNIGIVDFFVLDWMNAVSEAIEREAKCFFALRAILKPAECRLTIFYNIKRIINWCMVQMVKWFGVAKIQPVNGYYNISGVSHARPLRRCRRNVCCTSCDLWHITGVSHHVTSTHRRTHITIYIPIYTFFNYIYIKQKAFPLCVCAMQFNDWNSICR